VFTWRKNGASQASTCTISGAAAVSCSDTTHSFTVAQGDLLDVQCVASGTIIVTPVVVITTLYGTTGNNGTVNTGTQGRFGYYASNGTTISESGASTAHAVALFEGTSAPAASNVGTTGQCFQGVTGADPAFSTCPASGSAVTYGAYAALPGSGTTAGDQYITNDSSYRFTWTGSVWAAAYLATPVTIPPAVSALTWVNQGGATTDETVGGIYLEIPASGSPNLRSLVKTLPACPGGSTFTIGLQNYMQGANFVHNGIYIRDSGTNRTIIFGPGYNGGYQVAVEYYTNNTTFSSAPKEQNFHTLPLWYRVVDDCTNFS